MERAILEAERRRLAKRANQRMLRLERAHMDMNPQGPYMQARMYLGANRKRFSEQFSFRGTTNQLENEIERLRSFLSAKTSTVQGFRRVQKQRIDSLVKQGFTREQAESESMKRFLRDVNEIKKNANFDSDQIFSEFKEATKHATNEDRVKLLDTFEKWAAQDLEKRSLKNLHYRFARVLGKYTGAI